MPRDYRRLLAYSWPVRIGLGLVFLYSAFPKLQDVAGTVRNVQAYNVLPEPLAQAYGYVLPFAELGLGLLLVLGLFTRLAALGGAALLGSFIVAIGMNLARGDHPECGCFSVAGGSALDWTTLARDVVLLAGMALPFFDRGSRFSLDRWIAGEPAGGEGDSTARADERAG